MSAPRLLPALLLLTGALLTPALGKTATLEVRQIDAQKLALAQQVGTLGLVLRNPADQTESYAETVSIEDLRDGGYARMPSSAPVVMAAAAAPMSFTAPRGMVRPRPLGPSVQIVRGVKGTSYEVGGHAGF